MRFNPTPLAVGIALALTAAFAANPAFAQAKTEAEKKAEEEKAAAAKRATPEKVETLVVTGIRASLQQSIDTKRDADTNVEVVTAEDVGKMPDKNIADALSRLSGVNVQYGGALAMDEAERIAIRGTSPNLNLTTVNGHALSSGDWHVGDQAGSGRSVGFGLMPSQLIGKAIVYKTGRADITEGGIAGTVDIQTRKPLDFRAPFVGEVSLGFVHADLPKKTDPQISGLVGWQNQAKTFGAMVQAYSEKRTLRRDGQETFGFNFVSTAAATNAGNPALAGLRLPGSLNSALFEGKREREGGYIGLQFKPNRNIDLNFSAFRSVLDADNYNSSAFALPNTLISNGWIIKNPVIKDDVIVSASLERPANAAATQQVIGLQFDHNLRRGATSLSSFYDLEGNFNIGDALTLKARAGYTEGSGKTGNQPSLTFAIINPNVSYSINGDRPTDYRLTDSRTGQPIDLSNINNYRQMSNTGAGVKSTDEETYFHLDGDYKLNLGPLTNLKFGMRTAKHDREYEVIAARWNAQDNATGPVTPSPFISVTGGALVTNIVGNNIPAPATYYPGNWGSGLSADFPRNLYRFTPGILSDFADRYVNWDPVLNKTWNSGYKVTETNNAGYIMGEFDFDKITGNFGLRPVETKVESLAYQALNAGTGVGQCTALAPCSVPGAINTSRVATYIPQLVKTKHRTTLPSLNLRWEVAKGMIGRFAASKTLGRPNYNELAAAFTNVNNTLLTASSGNPLLKPTTANNIDASFAWYFARRGYVSGSLFQQKLKDYVKPGVSQVEFFNTSTGSNSVCQLS
jgi:iron complex outermembrane recepter protein